VIQQLGLIPSGIGQKQKGRPEAAVSSQTGPFSCDQRIVEVPELVIATGLPALITWVDWAVWL
jgi:hypothetical protein